MFDALRFRLAVWQIRRRTTRRINQIEREELKSANPRGRAVVAGDTSNVWQAGEEEIAWRYSMYLLERLDKLLLPRLGPEPENWTGGVLINKEYLSPAAAATARDSIRRERKERTENARLWLGAVAPIITAIAGLVGALIGLAAIWGHGKSL